MQEIPVRVPCVDDAARSVRHRLRLLVATTSLLVVAVTYSPSLGTEVHQVIEPTHRDTVQREEHPERTAKIQFPVFLVLLGLPPLGLALAASCRKVRPPAQRFLGRIVVVVPALEIALYVYYETGISVYSNIRIDLLLVWPALLLSLSLWLRAWRGKLYVPHT